VEALAKATPAVDLPVAAEFEPKQRKREGQGDQQGDWEPDESVLREGMPGDGREVTVFGGVVVEQRNVAE